MNTCPTCYNQCREGAKFCSRCGYRFNQPGSFVSPTPPPAQSYAQECAVPPPTAPIQSFIETPANQYAMEKHPDGAVIEQYQIKDLHEKARKIVRLFSTVAGGIALLWLPLVDMVILLSLQCYMVITVAKIFGQKLPFAVAKELMFTCFAGAIGFLGAYACGTLIPIPYIGWILKAPVMFASTYGIGDVAIAYFSQEGKLTKSQMRDIYNRSFHNSKEYYSGDLNDAKESLNNIKEYLTPEEYERLKKKLG